MLVMEDMTTNRKEIDMQGIKWTPLNDANGYHKWIDFDGRNHVVKNLTCESGTYRSFFGVLCGECRNVGFVDANISSSSTGIGIIAGYVGLAAGAENYTGKIPVLLLSIRLLTIQVKPGESSEG